MTHFRLILPGYRWVTHLRLIPMSLNRVPLTWPYAGPTHFGLMHTMY
jgi:hypothetical protein